MRETKRQHENTLVRQDIPLQFYKGWLEYSLCTCDSCRDLFACLVKYQTQICFFTLSIEIIYGLLNHSMSPGKRKERAVSIKKYHVVAFL